MKTPKATSSADIRKRTEEAQFAPPHTEIMGRLNEDDIDTDALDASDEDKNLDDFLDEVEEKLNTLASKVETTADGAVVQADLGLAELGQRWQNALTWISERSDELLAIPNKAKETTDMAWLKLNLAKMDAAQAVEEMLGRLDRMRQRIESVQTTVDTDAREILGRLRSAVLNIRQNLMH